MKIVQLYDQQMESKHTPIKVMEVCSNGLNFVSYLHLPIHENVVWSFQFQVWEEEEFCEGTIYSRRRIKGGYEYKTQLSSTLERLNSVRNKVSYRYTYFNENLPAKLIDLSC
jgi:hypothetical protein